MNRRSSNGSSSLPHGHVYARLRPSQIHKGGVGVFAIRNIKKGAHLFPGDDENLIWVERRKVAKTPAEIRKLYQDFAVLKNGKYGSPQNFNLLTVAWYLNEPKAGSKPNVRCDPKTYKFYALRDIRAGEELTVNYSTYSEPLRSRDSRKRKRDPDTSIAA